MSNSETPDAPSTKPPRRHPTISLAEFSAIHDPDLGAEDRPHSLKQICELVFGNTISVATLKAEHARGNLEMFKIGRQYFTTRRNIAAMMEKCRLPSKAPSSKAARQGNLTEEATRSASLAAAKLTAEKLISAAREKRKRRSNWQKEARR